MKIVRIFIKERLWDGLYLPKSYISRMVRLICESFLIKLIVKGNWTVVNCLKAFQF